MIKLELVQPECKHTLAYVHPHIHHVSCSVQYVWVPNEVFLSHIDTAGNETIRAEDIILFLNRYS
jgi:hypothetical protein